MRSALIGIVLAAMLAGCQGAPGVEGKYSAAAQDGRTVSLNLKSGYQGEWETSTDTVALRWEVRGGEVWLHSKSGGVIRGTVENGRIRVSLPGEGELVFSRPGG